ncbi:MAG TPA: hypothetical protein VF741_04240, partial [Candidatus Aquilonibacter sp.]
SGVHCSREDSPMIVAFAAVLGAAIAVPLIALAWAIKPRQCPHCGASIEPDERLVRMVTGE